MRLDKLLSECGVASRSEAAKACRAGSVTVNGAVARKSDLHVNPDVDAVVYCGRTVNYRKFVYLMLNKPDGYVSATEDGKDPVVTELLPAEYRKMGLFPCGRLDKHTLGLMLLTNDGQLAHDLLSPRHHVAKRYRFTVKFPLTEAEVARLEEGTTLDDGYETKPSKIELNKDAHSGIITLIEGKYHQIKRMMESVHNQITSLERISFGPLTLDDGMERGEWRYLTESEEDALQKSRRGTLM